nr:NAD(P)/FAD-dependent oxidoreductase [Candidatus Njordarchaeum guaymaensis]
MAAVTVIGAGPAGLAAAEVLARRGIEVTVIEKDTNPGEMKPCGGMLRIDGVETFRIPWRLASRQIKGMRVVMPNHKAEEVDYSHVISLNIDRGVLGRYLVGRVRELGGIVNTGSKVVDVNWLGDKEARNYELICIGVDDRVTKVRTELLIGADGTSSMVVKKTGVHQSFKPNQLGLCVQHQIRLENSLIEQRIGDMNEVYYGRDVSPFGYAWIAPKNNLVTVGVGALLSAVKGSLKNYLNYFVRKHPIASRKLEGGKILRTETALCPLSGPISPTFDNNLIVAGDAAGHCSPVSGEGVYYSMVAGRIAGQIASEAIKANNLSARYLGRYERLWRRTIASDLRWGRLLQGIANRRGFMSGTFKKETPLKSRLNRKVTDILTGVRPYKQTLIKAIPEFVLAKVIG